MSSDADSWLPYAGIGGLIACCLGLELLGGAVVLGGLAATIGLSTGVTYLAVVGIGGLVALGLAAGFHHVVEVNDGILG